MAGGWARDGAVKEQIESLGTFQKIKGVKSEQEEREIVYIVYKVK